MGRVQFLMAAGMPSRWLVKTKISATAITYVASASRYSILINIVLLVLIVAVKSFTFQSVSSSRRLGGNMDVVAKRLRNKGFPPMRYENIRCFVGSSSSRRNDVDSIKTWRRIDYEDVANKYDDRSGTREQSRHPLAATYMSEEWHNACCQVASYHDLKAVTSPLPSPIETVMVNDRRVYVKRDDLLRLHGSNASGNKARKMLVLGEMIPAEDFPDVVVSYGGPQSNAMLALAAICAAKNSELLSNEQQQDEDDKDGLSELLADSENFSNDDDDYSIDGTTFKESEKSAQVRLQVMERPDEISLRTPEPRKRFIYYTKKLPRYLRNQPNGNLLRAKTLGMELVELSHAKYQELFGGPNGGPAEPPAELEPPIPGNSIWVPQGGFSSSAIPGVRRLANEIATFWIKNGEGPLAVVVPAGTGTTAFFLQRELNRLSEEDQRQRDIRVIAVPCIGDDAYLRRQMMYLDKSCGGSGAVHDLPDILLPRFRENQSKGYFTFGVPSKEILDVFREMEKDHGIFLDLLYGAPTWALLLPHLSSQASVNVSGSPTVGKQIMYLHCGGLEGVSSQLTRYKHQGLISPDELQI